MRRSVLRVQCMVLWSFPKRDAVGRIRGAAFGKFLGIMFGDAEEVHGAL